MRASLLLPLSLPLLAACGATWTGEPVPPVFPEAPDPVADVNPMIGTGGPGYRVGSSSPAATTPFGLVKLGPDTALEWGGIDAQHCSGYFYDDTYIDGFSHVRLHGTGVADYGTVLVMPLLDTDGTGVPDTMRSPDDWREGFSHTNETAEPGYYAVTLNNGIRAELTASPHAGYHRYTFPTGSVGTVVFDLEHVLGGGGAGAEVNLDPTTGDLSGWMLDQGSFVGGYGGFRTYFYVHVAEGFTSSGSWSEGNDVGAWIASPTQTLTLDVGISLVSVDEAKANLTAENLGDFDAQVEAARAAWEAPLQKFELVDATDDERALFYTSVYHLLQMPTTQSDVDGGYLGFDQAVHTDPGFTFYSDMSLWDTYRTANPAYMLFYPEQARDFASSLVTMAAQGGALPRWPAASGESGSMLGLPANVVLAETALKGIDGWDQDAGFADAVGLTLGDIRGTPSDPPDPDTLEQYGYLPSDQFGTSVAWVQEVAWADNAVGLWAQKRGEAQTAARLAWRSRFWKNLYDPDVGFFHARLADGSFAPLTSETDWSEEYAEGNAWQYLWLAAQPAELAEVLGGTGPARDRLTTFFTNADAEGLVTGPAAYYWQGNEPDLHAAFLFALWGDPDSTGTWQRWVEDERYANAPDGLAGNDDGGTLAAWYVFSTLGIYPLAGTDTYVIGVPRYTAARFAVTDPATGEDAGWFSIYRDGTGDHVKQVTLNGVVITRPYLHHAELTAGGELHVEME